jgi:hypothetical protein
MAAARGLDLIIGRLLVVDAAERRPSRPAVPQICRAIILLLDQLMRALTAADQRGSCPATTSSSTAPNPNHSTGDVDGSRQPVRRGTQWAPRRFVWG